MRLVGVVGAVALIVLTNGRAFGAAVDADAEAAAFVALALQLGSLPEYGEEVDSYFGRESLRPSPAEPPAKIAALAVDTDALLRRIEHEQQLQPTARGARLLAQVRSFGALLEVIEQPRRWDFEQEALHVYGMSMPSADPAATRHALIALDAALPGSGSLSQRLADFRSHFVVPLERREAVFDRALQECRRRTLTHWKLPSGERLDVEWTSGVGAAWQRYRGHGRSTLQINPEAVALIGSAIDVACHEAYPGHHAQFLLMEQRAGMAGLPVEEQLVLLRSPASVLREGAANFGIALAFPLEERVVFDRQVLFPLAGLDPAQARRYETVHQLIDQLSSSTAPILAAYRDGRLSFGVAASELVTDAGVSSPAALLQFVDRYGAYTLGYTSARDRLRDYVNARRLRTGEDDWTVLREIVAEPSVAVLFTK
jgi:hypothetical protein